LINLTGHKKILIVRLGKIGDIIIASAAIESLKNKFPDSDISLFTLKKNKDVLKYNVNINHLFLTNKNFDLYFKILSLRKYKFDVLIDLNDDPSKTSVVLRKFIKSKTTVGYNFDEKNKPDISVTQQAKNETHIIERMKSLLQAMNVELDEREFIPKIYLGEIEKNEIYEIINRQKNNSKIIAINISAGAPIRYWPVDKWTKLLNKITTTFNQYKILILSTEEDQNIRNRICKNLNSDSLIYQNYYSFQHYASYICYSDILITPDTAAVHIASAFDVPVIALYPNYEWNFISWQPLSKKYRSLKSNTESIADIKIEEVYNSFKDILTEIEK